jgi:uncharacterized protein YeaO (DUF488 family)
MVRIKRAYAPAERGDGYRVLVDRLWPRGVTKAEAAVDLWAKDVAPTPELRKWFAHGPERFREFALRYRRELRDGEAPEVVQELARRAARETVTLVYGAWDEVHNGAVVLQEVLQAKERPAASPGGGREPLRRARSRG